MKANKKSQATQRKIIEQKIKRLSKLSEEKPPPSGWVKAIRGSLGITIRQLASRMGTVHGSISQLEKREPLRKVTLDFLDRAARAMDCRLVYAIIPNESGADLESIISKKAYEAAALILKDVAHSMRLEAQGTSEKDFKKEVDRIAAELKDKHDSRIWDIKKINTKNGKN